jgi:hypothetical protein
LPRWYDGELSCAFAQNASTLLQGHNYNDYGIVGAYPL